MSEEQKEKQPRFKTSPKLYFYLGGLVGLLAFIGISAWWDLTFGAFDAKNFIADTLILIGIAIGTMFLTDLLSQETNMNKVIGVFNIARNDYENIYRQIAGILIYFSQWYLWYLGKETKKKREGYLVLHGIDGISAKKIVAYAALSDIPEMVKCEKFYVKTLPNGKKIPFKKVETKEQEEAIYAVLKGEQDVKNTAYSTYLFTEDEAEINMSVLERQEYLERRRKQSKRKSYIMRVVSVVFIALLMAALAPADEEEGGGKNRWWLLMKRLSVFVTSFISGWLAGATDVTARAAKVKDKIAILHSFKDCYDKKLWIPKSEEELDQEAVNEWEQAEEKTNAANNDGESHVIHQEYTKDSPQKE